LAGDADFIIILMHEVDRFCSMTSLSQSIISIILSWISNVLMPIEAALIALPILHNMIGRRCRLHNYFNARS
jgi:hypothetical protein